MQSAATQPPPPPPVADPPGPQHQHSTSGETAGTGATGHSDLSQALLYNTAALEGNLSAALRGADVDTSAEADELRHLTADATMPAHHPEAIPDPALTPPGAFTFLL